MGDRSDPHTILFKLFLDHYHHHCQCSANEGKPYMFVFISQKDVQLSTWACVTKITVWLSVVSISSLGGYSKYNWTGTCCKVIASLRSSSLVFHYILASLIYFRFYLSIISLLRSDIQHHVWSIRQQVPGQAFCSVGVEGFVSVSVGPGRVGTNQQSSFIRKPPGGGVGNESLDSQGLFSFLQARLLSLSQVK